MTDLTSQTIQRIIKECENWMSDVLEMNEAHVHLTFTRTGLYARASWINSFVTDDNYFQLYQSQSLTLTFDDLDKLESPNELQHELNQKLIYKLPSLETRELAYVATKLAWSEEFLKQAQSKAAIAAATKTELQRQATTKLIEQKQLREQPNQPDF